MAFKHIEETMKRAVASSVWRPTNVAIEPDTKLTQWQAHRVTTPDGISTTHFMGYTGFEGRVCSAVQAYDPKTRKGITKSGRVYELLGPPGFNRDALYVFSIWCDRFPETTKFEDVTKEYGDYSEFN